jgi:23S rRNA (guanosine2251-2'-O)-methyltransferase
VSGREQLYGIHPVREALRAGRRKVHRLRVRKGSQRGPLSEIAALARELGIPIAEVEPAALTRMVPPGAPSQGVVLEADPLPEVPLEVLAGDPASSGGFRSLVALDGVEDPQNVGAIARVAEAAGVGGLILTRRRAPPLGPAVARASAGAIEWLPMARVPNLVRTLNWLKSNGFWIFGADPEGDQGLFEVPARLVQGHRVVVLGAEGHGLRQSVVRALDHRLRIPTAGRVGSLNVSSAAAVVLFELARRAGT